MQNLLNFTYFFLYLYHTKSIVVMTGTTEKCHDTRYDSDSSMSVMKVGTNTVKSAEAMDVIIDSINDTKTAVLPGWMWMRMKEI